MRAERPDIVLADVGMPERDGYEVAAFIKGDPRAGAHAGAAADRRVRAARRGAGARGRLRRRPGQAVRAADGDRPRARAAVGPSSGRRGARAAASRRGRRRDVVGDELDAAARRRRPPLPIAGTPATRSRTISIDSTRRSPTSSRPARPHQHRRVEPAEDLSGRIARAASRRRPRRRRGAAIR